MMLKRVEMKPGVIIVELGAGTGAFTRMILERLPADGRLVIFEINPVLAGHLRRNIIDSRVVILEADAVLIVDELRELNISKPDYIISGIPIGNMKPSSRLLLLSAIHDSLDENGMYIQFQYFLASLVAIRKLFHTKIIGYEYRNFPPAFVYNCRKKVV